MWADRFVGLPFRDPGFMCGDLVRQVLAQVFDVTVDDNPAGSDIEAHIDALRNNGQWTEIDHPQAGDVALMMTPIGFGVAAPLHVGIMVTPVRVLHVDRGKRSVCQSLSDPDIRARLARFYRHSLLKR